DHFVSAKGRHGFYFGNLFLRLFGDGTDIDILRYNSTTALPIFTIRLLTDIIIQLLIPLSGIINCRNYFRENPYTIDINGLRGILVFQN
ncbi:hypothetical protein, partial [Serratia sp. C2(2)]|uniref:hypothetical protein n=1 Tax=Serratia sp. C2(2) TaxID=3117678 RepID=UPI002ED68F5F|nr:hypothetical protein [Serratia sp. C2(2)]